MNQSITKFCSQPTKKNWEIISIDTQSLFKTVALFCIKQNIGKHVLARKILNLSKLPSTQIFLSSEQRLFAAKNIESVFWGLKKVTGQQCINGLNEVLGEFLTVKKMLGSGSFGNVYEACAPKPCRENTSYKFAIKLARVPVEAINKPYANDVPAWGEYFILHDILNPLVENGICINLPYLIDTFTCNKCDFKELLGTPGGTQQHPCLIFLTELAQGGTLKDWFNRPDLKVDDYYNALFQMMAGIHAIQMYGQIWNFDVKSVNTLIYNVEPGGYWVYNILDTDYYIPNRGYIVILNDFGVSQVFSPDYCHKYDSIALGKSLGTRGAMIIDDKYSPLEGKINWDMDGRIEKLKKLSWGTKSKAQSKKDCTDIDIQYVKTVGESLLVCKDNSRGRSVVSTLSEPFVLDCKIQFTPEQIKALEKLGIPADSSQLDFYRHPHIIPPLEYRGDTQDVIRTFIGGPRYSQSGWQPTPPGIPKDMVTLLTPYLVNDIIDGREGNLNQCGTTFLTTPSVDLAGYFINDFFQKHYTKFGKSPGGKLLSTFTI